MNIHKLADERKVAAAAGDAPPALGGTVSAAANF